MLLPLLGAITAGLFGHRIGRNATHCITVSLVAMAFVLSMYLVKVMLLDAHPAIEGTLYTWATAGSVQFDVALLLDRLSTVMLFVVLFISLAVHIYTIGCMADDPGYQRFFSYVSLFTFAMLVLVLANNFLLLFFGWEGVGLVSYLLIGFWFTRDTATFGSLKAFIVNRIGDIGFILATAAVLMYFGSLNYHEVFEQIPSVLNKTMPFIPGYDLSVLSA